MRNVTKDWSVAEIGDLRGKTMVVTGANSGIGFHTALELGRAGAKVVVACRDETRGRKAVARMQAAAPQATFEFEPLDLADLASVRAFADRFLASGEPLDVLVNNAGVMAVPKRELTVDGFERQFGTNVLGHFALTGLLLPALAKSAAPRVVTISSGTAYFGCVDLGNLQGEKRYSASFTYAQSKLGAVHENHHELPWPGFRRGRLALSVRGDRRSRIRRVLRPQGEAQHERSARRGAPAEARE